MPREDWWNDPATVAEISQRPRPQSVLFAPSAGYQNPGAALLPDFAPVAPASAAEPPLAARARTPGEVSPAAPPLAGTDMSTSLGGRGPSWDRLRDVLGADIGGQRVPAPRIFNEGREQHPLTALDVHPEPLSAQLDNLNRQYAGDPFSAAVLRNAIIHRHNQNLDLQNTQRNAAQGLFTPTERESVARWGTPSLQGGGTESRLAGAQETTAGAHQLQALTGAATLEQAMSTAMQRQRFMERFPHLTAPQINELVAGEEARGGFAPRTLRFPIGGASTTQVGGQPVTAAGAPVPAPQSSLLSDATAEPTFADIVNRAVPKLTIGKDIGPGELMMRLARSNPGLFANPAHRNTLRQYLESRYGRDIVAQAVQGTRSLGPISWSTQVGPSFGGMTPEQEGRAVLEAALGRNQW